MGLVYKARDERLERHVALKFLSPHLSTQPAAKQRFLIEARAAAALEHPNVCTIHEIGETDEGHLFLSMPLYDGETLESRLKRGRLSFEQAAPIAAQIARGLARAHEGGIVHRDVKPSNVMLLADGTAKILDFGIAKRDDLSLTGSGVPLGTIAYMSPEQVRGTRSIIAPTSGRSACCCTKCSPARGRLAATTARVRRVPSSRGNRRC